MDIAKYIDLAHEFEAMHYISPLKGIKDGPLRKEWINFLAANIATDKDAYVSFEQSEEFFSALRTYVIRNMAEWSLDARNYIRDMERNTDTINVERTNTCWVAHGDGYTRPIVVEGPCESSVLSEYQCVYSSQYAEAESASGRFQATLSPVADYDTESHGG